MIPIKRQVHKPLLHKYSFPRLLRCYSQAIKLLRHQESFQNDLDQNKNKNQTLKYLLTKLLRNLSYNTPK